MVRQNLPELLHPGAIAVELGVAKGIFSEQLLNNLNIGFLYSVDAWAGDRGHDTKEYCEAVKRLQPHKSRNAILRMRFSDALTLFEDETFDLVYVDGYAHEWERGTVNDWWPKVRPGGIFAGHDYSDKWPLVVKEVDMFAAKNKLDVNIIPAEPGKFTFPSWYFWK